MVSLSVGFNILIARHAATLATGFGLLTWQVYLLPNIPALAGRTTVVGKYTQGRLQNASNIEPPRREILGANKFAGCSFVAASYFLVVLHWQRFVAIPSCCLPFLLLWITYLLAKSKAYSIKSTIFGIFQGGLFRLTQNASKIELSSVMKDRLPQLQRH